MVSITAARKLALALPDATEQPYHEVSSYRVRGKVFATVPDDEHLHLMLAADEIRVAVHDHPAACEEKWWGKKLAALRVSLPDITEAALRPLLTDAWQRRAPRDLLE